MIRRLLMQAARTRHEGNDGRIRPRARCCAPAICGAPLALRRRRVAARAWPWPIARTLRCRACAYISLPFYAREVQKAHARAQPPPISPMSPSSRCRAFGMMRWAPRFSGSEMPTVEAPLFSRRGFDRRHRQQLLSRFRRASRLIC